jgi:hypothetical protein
MDHEQIAENIGQIHEAIKGLKIGQDRILSNVDILLGKPCQDLTKGEVTHLKLATKLMLVLGTIVVGIATYTGGRATFEWVVKVFRHVVR